MRPPGRIRIMPLKVSQWGIIQRCTAHGLVIQREGAGLDHVKPGTKTGGQPDRGTEVLRNIWLKKYDPHFKPRWMRVWGHAAGCRFASIPDTS